MKHSTVSKIERFERQRLLLFTPQIRVNATHWEAFKSTLAKSSVENERVLAFFTKRIDMEEKYCEHLAELPYMDLTGTGGWRTGTKKCPPPGSGVAKASISSKPSKSSVGAGAVTSKTACATSTTTKDCNKSSEGTLPAMDTMMASTDTLVTKYSDYVRDTRRELVDGKLRNLVNSFKRTSDEVLEEGCLALENVNAAESHIVAAFAEYMKGAGNLTSYSKNSTTTSPHQQQQGTPDLWLLDMQYRVAVELQKTIWQETQHHLHDLFRRMKTLEVNRRSQLNALVLRFMQNQGSFWAQLPQAAAECSLAISTLSCTDPHQVEEELSEEIKTCAKAAEQKEQHHSSGKENGAKGRDKDQRGVNVKAADDDAASGAAVPEPFVGNLMAPLDSPLVRRAEVLEHRRVTGVESLPLMKRWRPCLAVLTLDNFLHIFDMPSEVTAGTVLSPREAFKLLVPRPINRRGRFRKGKDVERVIPSHFLALPYSSARYRPEEGAEAFDVTEARENTGFVSVFKAREVTRVVLKARTQEKMEAWVAIVNSTLELEKDARATADHVASPESPVAASKSPGTSMEKERREGDGGDGEGGGHERRTMPFESPSNEKSAIRASSVIVPAEEQLQPSSLSPEALEADPE